MMWIQIQPAPPLLAPLAAGDGNPYWIIALLVIAAINWIAQKLGEKRNQEHLEEIERQAREMEEFNAGSEEPRVQTEPPPLPPRGARQTPPPPPPRKVDATEPLRRLFEALGGEPMTTAPRPPEVFVEEPVFEEPPPLPRADREIARVPPPIDRPQSHPYLTDAERSALEKIGKASKLTHGRTRRQRMRASSERAALAAILRRPETMRNAIILKEILDAPVAARASHLPHDFP